MHNFIDKPSIFSAKLQKWFILNKRNLPWRGTNDPYKIWLSEIILQQTRVDQGIAYYLKFIRNYPTIADLANADEEEILKDWQGLGYYSRARNLHFTAKTIQNELNGIFPNSFEKIKKLKGIGDYTAAAISSFAFDESKAVVDGNVYRLLARLIGSEIPIDTTEGKKFFQALADQLIDNNNPGPHNQAIMEFGALHCTPKNQKCETCVFNDTCIAQKLGTQDLLPIKKNKIKQRKRYFNYFILENEAYILIHKRATKGIWQNLYDFPMIEMKSKTSTDLIIDQKEFTDIIKDCKFKLVFSSAERKHILSHQIIMATFHHIQISERHSFHNASLKWIKKSSFNKYPIPKLIENYLKEETNFLSLLNS